MTEGKQCPVCKWEWSGDCIECWVTKSNALQARVKGQLTEIERLIEDNRKLRKVVDAARKMCLAPSEDGAEKLRQAIIELDTTACVA